MKLVPKCQYNSGNAFGNLNKGGYINQDGTIKGATASDDATRLVRHAVLQNTYDQANTDQSTSEIARTPSESMDEYVNRNQEYLNTGKNQQKVKFTSTPMVRGMSGSDPVGSFVTSMVAMNGPSRAVGSWVTKGVSKVFPAVGRWVSGSTKYSVTHPKTISRVKKVLNTGVAPIQNGSIRETAIGQVPVKAVKLKIASGN